MAERLTEGAPSETDADSAARLVEHRAGEQQDAGAFEDEVAVLLDVRDTRRLDERDRAKAKQQVDQMCAKLLANTVIENYAIDLVD